jgi:hypothetical protein
MTTAPVEATLDGDPIAAELAAEQRLEQTAVAMASLIESMQAQGGKNAMELLQQRSDLMQTSHKLAIKNTRPEDWILTKDKQGNEIAMLSGPGADQVANLFGIHIANIRPLAENGTFAPERQDVDGLPGVYTLRAWCDCGSRMTGRVLTALEASIRSDEDFTGRSLDKAGRFDFKGERGHDADLRAALQTRLRTKAVRVLGGLTRVPVSDLAGAGLDVARCRRGHGYGTSSERSAQAGADPGVLAEASELWKEILRRTGGDEGAAAQTLKEITAYPAHSEGKYKAFAGCKSWQELNSEPRVKKARTNLEKHQQFGAHAGREPGAD